MLDEAERLLGLCIGGSLRGSATGLQALVGDPPHVPQLKKDPPTGLMHPVRHLPVVRGQKLVGLLTHRDLLAATNTFDDAFLQKTQQLHLGR